MTTIPWVEKYRPTNFNDIILDENNNRIFSNILKKNYFPNLLFYGPPGTGKTTTIINLIKAYQINNNQNSAGLLIHLNASDDRGIDVIRNQISVFVNSKTLFNSGIKFVILDEVDYMTKNAQYAFKYLLQTYKSNVRFCLICNYISRIDNSLQNEFIRIRFNQLPVNNIINFITDIGVKEGLKIKPIEYLSIQKLYKSDIRSMINYMQSNQYNINKYNIVDDEMCKNILSLFKTKSSKEITDNIIITSKTYNIEIQNIIKNLFSFIIKNYTNLITIDLLNNIRLLMHSETPNLVYTLVFSVEIILLLLKSDTEPL